ncbi:MAG: hypothetical protein LBP76_12885 [Treponema sp.]|jgi:hypothetical protein|nr:hypothetical protein [Treponema sp.]
MERMMFEKSLTKETYLGILMREFGISLLGADDYYNAHQNELHQIRAILFSCEKEDRKKCIALLHILTRGKSGRMIGKYYDKYVKCWWLKFLITRKRIVSYVEKYKLPLMAVLLCDNDFFWRVKEWYGDISEYAGMTSASNRVRISKVSEADFSGKVDVWSATGAGYAPIRIGAVSVPSLGGKLIFLGNRVEEQIQFEVRFQFLQGYREALKKYNLKNTGDIPFFVEVDISFPDENENGQLVVKTIPLDVVISKEQKLIGSLIRSDINYLSGFYVMSSRIMAGNKRPN